jgi:hypothetical protein
VLVVTKLGLVSQSRRLRQWWLLNYVFRRTHSLVLWLWPFCSPECCTLPEGLSPSPGSGCLAGYLPSCASLLDAHLGGHAHWVLWKTAFQFNYQQSSLKTLPQLPCPTGRNKSSQLALPIRKCLRSLMTPGKEMRKKRQGGRSCSSQDGWPRVTDCVPIVNRNTSILSRAGGHRPRLQPSFWGPNGGYYTRAGSTLADTPKGTSLS